MSIRRLTLALILALSWATPTPVNAAGQKKAVHVKEYKKKDGTVVKAHDRNAPKEKVAKAPPKARAVDPASAARDERGRIQRSEAARHAFARQTGYPHGRPGYVIDHIVPLACGGPDTPANMQWQTIAEGKAKDATERIGCR